MPHSPLAHSLHTHHDLEGAVGVLLPQITHRCRMSPPCTLTMTPKELLGSCSPKSLRAAPCPPLARPLHTHLDLEGAVGVMLPPRSLTYASFHPLHTPGTLTLTRKGLLGSSSLKSLTAAPWPPLAHPLHTHHDLEGAAGVVLPQITHSCPLSPPCTPLAHSPRP